MQMKCPTCNGTGNVFARDEAEMKCRTCDGTGVVEDRRESDTLQAALNQYGYPLIKATATGGDAAIEIANTAFVWIFAVKGNQVELISKTPQIAPAKE